METFGERLRRLRDERDISLNELARRTGKDPGGLSRIERGQRWGGKQPPADDIQLFADAIGVTFDELRGIVPTPGEPTTEEVPEIQRVPLAELLERIGAKPVTGEFVEGLKLSAGPGARIPDGFEDARRRGRRGKGKQPERIQVIEVEGQCMESVLYAGDKVLIDTWQMPSIGQVVAAVRFFDDSIVKFLREKNGYQYFEGMDGTVIPLDQYTRIVGPVIDVQQSIWRRIEEARRLLGVEQ